MAKNKIYTPRFVGAQLTAEAWETMATIPDADPQAFEEVSQEIGQMKTEVGELSREIMTRAAPATWAIRSPYLSLATAAFICMRDHLGRSKYSAAHRFQKSYLETMGSAHEGIGLMCGYLANAAIVYKASRPEFAGMPEQVEQQVAELGQIALRGGEFLGQIAKIRSEVSMRVEEEILLDGYQLPTTTQARRQALLNRYELWEDHQGLLITTVKPIEQVLAEVEVRMALETSEARSREENENEDREPLSPLLSSQKRASVGCVALLRRNNQQESPFNVIYHRLVATAAQPSGLFTQDLLNPDI